METYENLIGRFAFSRAGHDKGSLYAIVAANERSLSLADGAIKKLAAPKEKNRRHLQLTNASLPPELISRLREGSLRDEELMRALRLYQKEHGQF